MIQYKNAVERFNKIILSELKDANITCWIAGGSLRDYFMGIPLKTDYDLFFPNEVEYEKCKAHFIALEAKIKWESDNGMKVKYNGKTFDLIKHYFNSPQDTIDNFDFTVSMFAVDFEKVYHGESSFVDLAKRQLMFNKITYPASTLCRSFRYYKKGFSMCLGEMKKLAQAIQNMPKPEQKNDGENSIGDDDENVPSGKGDLSEFFIGID